MANLPSIPIVEGDFIIDLYLHPSLQSDAVNDDYGDMNRLQQLGQYALNLVLHTHFFRARPILTAAQIADEVTAAITDAKLREWLAAYGIHTKYRGPVKLLESTEDMYRFFHGFIGALYYRHGLDRVQVWISGLLDPNAYNSAAAPPPPVNSPPPLPNQASSPRTGSVLMNLNEAVQRHGVTVTYPAEQTGPPHAPTWSVKCVIGGVEKGQGSGKSQKVAKEQAAQQALTAMGPGW
ncbi:hypothetical protein FB45DRAFT_398520 [Roridomyces roridus]|uniref:Uncharacterized protein n=1 Tax=Roridomyces roridus TaxID=1738132 RepID=A0AAD7C3M7_9AGAR|nr:hypothetical protein FB45DRAFT_398520 [Roridomyces roridus]